MYSRKRYKCICTEETCNLHRLTVLMAFLKVKLRADMFPSAPHYLHRAGGIILVSRKSCFSCLFVAQILDSIRSEVSILSDFADDAAVIDFFFPKHSLV